MLAVAVRYNPKIELLDQRRPLCVKRRQFTQCFFCGAAIRAHSDEAAEHGSARDSHNRRIELNSPNQHGEENHDERSDKAKVAERLELLKLARRAAAE
jgi:hypothetical protein